MYIAKKFSLLYTKVKNFELEFVHLTCIVARHAFAWLLDVSLGGFKSFAITRQEFANFRLLNLEHVLPCATWSFCQGKHRRRVADKINPRL